ncbi:MAG: NAD(P)-dependent oxidoreductase [Pseudomonadales bacterium]
MLVNQRILVTGATGQVARPIVEQLNKNNEVWAAARFSDPKAKEELEGQGINTVYFSMGEEDLSALPDVDYVLHCGCNTDPKSPEIGMSQNAEGTGFLMSRYKDVKGFFHMSSSSIYGAKDDPAEPVNEEDQLGGFAAYSPHYAMSKQSTESVVRFLARYLNLPTIIARLDVAYGKCGHGGAPLALIEFMKYGIPYHSAVNGPSYCSPIYQDDIVEQIQYLVEHAAVPAPIVNLGGDEVVSMEEIIEYLEEITDLKATVVEKELATWGMTVLDNTKRNELAGPCKVSWKQGIRLALEARNPELLSG